MLSSLNDLRIVALDRLVLHEAHDAGRLSRLRRRIEAEEVQRNPVVVSPYGRDLLVLDGAHRVQILGELGCRFALAQLVDLPERTESWGHLMDGAGLGELHGVEGIELLEDGAGSSWTAGVEFAGGERVYVRPLEEGLTAEVRVLWSLQEFYREDAPVHRVDPESTVELDDGEALIRYRTFTPEELVEIVRSDAVLPAGITRFRIPERVLGVRFPLEKLLGGDIEVRNRELAELIREHWEKNRIRYYGEPVVLFE